HHQAANRFAARAAGSPAAQEADRGREEALQEGAGDSAAARAQAAPAARQLAESFQARSAGGAAATGGESRSALAQRRLEPGARRRWAVRLGVDAPPPHGNSRRGGAMGRGPSHRLLLFAGHGAGWRREERYLALDYGSRPTAVRFRQLSGVRLEPAPA